MISLAIAAGPLTPDCLYLKMPAKKLWERWEYVEVMLKGCDKY